MTIQKDLCVYLLLYQSLHDLTNRTVCNLKSVLVLMNALGRNLISVLDLTNPLGRRPISALVLTSHLKCQAILLILLCLAVPFFNSPGLFLFSYIYIYISRLTVVSREAKEEVPCEGLSTNACEYFTRTNLVKINAITGEPSTLALYNSR